MSEPGIEPLHGDGFIHLSSHFPLDAAPLALHSDLVNTLAPYIPFSCSLVFQHEPEDSPACQIFPGFTPAWFRQYMELDYREPWHADPGLRRRTFVGMGRALNAQFPELRIGGEPEKATGSISQIRTCALMGALFGQDIEYDAKTWPNNRGRPLTDAEVYSPVALARDSEATVRAELQRLYDAVGRCKIIVADIEAGTPRERLLNFYRIASDVWGLPSEV